MRAQNNQNGECMKFIMLLSIVIIANCASTNRNAFFISTEDYLKNKNLNNGTLYECNSEKVLVSNTEKQLLNILKDFIDSIKMPFYIDISDSNRIIFRSESEVGKYPQTTIYGILTQYNIVNSEIPTEIKKITSILKSGYIIPKDTSDLNSFEISAIKSIFQFIKTVHTNYNVKIIQAEGSLEIITKDRGYEWNKKELFSCNPKEDFVRLYDKWLIHDYKAHREIKQYDKKNPYPYEVIENEDSMAIKYRVKNDYIVKKPCNLRDAHEKLDSILSKNHKVITDETNMIEFHMGLGMWMRNNWGLWSGKSRLLPFFQKRNITNPDNMSGYILDTYKERVILLKKQPAFLNGFYSNIGDIECKK